MERISSAENQTLKRIKKLKQKKYREEFGLFIVEGLRACELAAQSPERIHSFYCSDSFASSAETSRFWEKFPCFQLPDKLFASLADTETPQGILCLAKLPTQNASFCGTRYLYLDCVRDPGNVGTIIRTADALGFDGVLLSEGCADLYSPKVVRSTMGSLFALHTETDFSYARLSALKNAGFSLIATALSETCVNLYEAEWNKKAVFILGNEANGISDAMLSLSDQAIKIPMHGSAESFNVSIAAALIMGEAARRKYEK